MSQFFFQFYILRNLDLKKICNQLGFCFFVKLFTPNVSLHNPDVRLLCHFHDTYTALRLTVCIIAFVSSRIQSKYLIAQTSIKLDFIFLKGEISHSRSQWCTDVTQYSVQPTQLYQFCANIFRFLNNIATRRYVIITRLIIF